MNKSKTNNEKWFKMIDKNIKITPEIGEKYNITDACDKCKYVIMSKSFQQKECGSRYCKDCYDKLESKFYCPVCTVENPNNFVHPKTNIFLDKALLKDLEKLEITCPDCNLNVKVLDLEEHVTNICENGWENCSLCDEMVKKNPKHVCSSLHLSSLHKQCKSCGQECEVIEDHICKINWTGNICPLGCEKTENARKHREQEHLFHLDKMWAILSHHGLTKCKKDHSSNFDSIVKSITNEVKTSLSINTDSLEPVLSTLKSLEEKMEQERSIYDLIRKNVQSQITDSLHTSFDGMILWRIDNFDMVKRKAVSGDQKSIFSPVFFTSRFGYKMCLRLYPNGDSTAWGIAMSLFLVLMKGNYDSLLTWPFKQKVTFILLDQEFKTNMIDAFVPPDNLSSFSRPRTDMNIPSGTSFFIKFDDMNQRKYLKDNTIFIRCIIDCSDLHE